MFGGGRGMGGGIGGGSSSMLRVASRVVSTRTTPKGHVSNLQDPITSSSSSTATSPRSSHKLNSPTTNTTTTTITTTTTQLCLSSSNLSSFGTPFGSGSNLTVSNYGSNGLYWPCFGDEDDWVPVFDASEGDEEGGERGVYGCGGGGGVVDDHFVLGPVPSIDEVHSAVSALSQ